MLQVLYEDHHLIAVNKPAPLLTQAPPGIPNLEELVKQYIREKYAKPAGVYLGVPHRLDRPVTGVVLFARNTKAAQRVHQQFHDRTVIKTYWALVEGTVAPNEGEWRDWMMKVPNESRAVKVEAAEPGAKEAVLNYRVMSPLPPALRGERVRVRGEDSQGSESLPESNASPPHPNPLPRSGGEGTRLELLPQTGRMHQLRAQCAWHGHPVKNDRQYGAKCEELADERERVIFLHARSLTIVHPFTKAELTLEAPCDW